jgi:hypothetical protein
MIKYKTFNNFRELKKQLRKLGIEKLVIDAHIEHEGAHFYTAIKLGYEPQIKFEIETDHKRKILNIKTNIYVPNVTKGDNKKIALAPKNPSRWDMARAKGWGTEARVL